MKPVAGGVDTQDRAQGLQVKHHEKLGANPRDQGDGCVGALPNSVPDILSGNNMRGFVPALPMPGDSGPWR
jgi:hypothetical protein